MVLSIEFETSRLVDRLKDARSRLIPCRPPIWARDGHSQTLLGHLLPSQELSPENANAGEKINVTLESENERIVTTYLRGRSRTVVYLFHGLGGYSHAHYMQRTARIARTLGHHVFLNNHRGCGEGAGLATEPYHSGRAEDLAAVIACGRRRFPGHRHIAVGFSLSANALLLLAAGIRADVLPDAAIAVNAPLDLDSASRRLCEGFNRVYDLNFTRDLKQAIEVRKRTGRMKETYRVPLITTVRELDQLYTAPAGGFRSREDYYETCSAGRYLAKLRIPTLLLTAADDPFVDVTHFRRARTSDLGVIHIEQHGGHVGYLTRNKTPLGDRRWLDYALREYITALS